VDSAAALGVADTTEMVAVEVEDAAKPLGEEELENVGVEVKVVMIPPIGAEWGDIAPAGASGFVAAAALAYATSDWFVAMFLALLVRNPEMS